MGPKPESEAVGDEPGSSARRQRDAVRRLWLPTLA